MSPQKRIRKISNAEIGMIAETYVSDPAYRGALNAPYSTEISNAEVEQHLVHQENAENVLIETVRDIGIHAKPEVQSWEAGRHAVAALLSRQALGAFEDYFLGPDSISVVPEAEPEILPAGEYGIVGLNHRIVSFGNSIADPLEFFDTSLGIIDRQKKLDRSKIGPENYATAAKLFSDKYISLERDTDESQSDALPLPDMTDIKELVDETLDGFFKVSSRDAPNYLEMTNMYAMMRTMPKGTIDPKFTHDILKYTADNMDQYTKRTAQVFLGALPKIDTSEYTTEASAIVNMILHSAGEFETTRDLRTTVRAIESLGKGTQTDAALRRFFELAEGFDQPLEYEGIDEVLDRLRHIVEDVTDDTELSLITKAFAGKCMSRANHLTRQLMAGGTLTQAQTEQLKVTYFRIKSNYQSL